MFGAEIETDDFLTWHRRIESVTEVYRPHHTFVPKGKDLWRQHFPPPLGGLRSFQSSERL